MNRSGSSHADDCCSSKIRPPSHFFEKLSSSEFPAHGVEQFRNDSALFGSTEFHTNIGPMLGGSEHHSK